MGGIASQQDQALGRTIVICLDKRTDRPIFKELWLIINSLRIRGRGYFRLWIYEPDDWRSTRMRVVINNLRSRRAWKARSWINDWPSHNHRWPSPRP
jgi:hypothetical protein